MCRKLILMSFVLLMAMAAVTMAVDFIWDDGESADHLWNSPNNWDWAGANTVPYYDANVATTKFYARVTAGATTYYPTMVSSAPNVWRLLVGGLGTGTATLTIESGVSLTVEDFMRLGNYGTGGNGTLTMNGGNLTVGTTGTVKRIDVGNKQTDGILNMNSGTITTGSLILGYTDGDGTIYLDGGTINVTVAGGLTLRNDLSGCLARIIISNGTMVLAGDQETAIANQSDYIIPSHPRGTVFADYNGTSTTVYAVIPDSNLAYGASPASGSTVTDMTQVLSWTPGDNAAATNGHKVYMSTDYNEVNDLNSAALMPSQPQTANSFDPDLVLDNVYYWRVVEVNGATEWAGDSTSVWNFTVPSYFVVDNFNTYTGTGEPGTAGTLRDVWLDWESQSPYTQAAVILAPGVHVNAMRIEYWNHLAPYYSDANLPISPAQNWNSSDIEALALSFAGVDDGNGIETLYVELVDSLGAAQAIPYNGDANDINNRTWQEWNIDLAGFTSIDMNSIAMLTIRVGTKGETSAGVSGDMYVDNIRLYTTRCVPTEAQAGDLDGDCVVDYNDIDVLKSYWLASDGNAYSTLPDANFLRAHWKFDETSDSNAYDSSGNGFTAQVLTTAGAPVTTKWDASGYDGGCINFDGTVVVMVNYDDPEVSDHNAAELFSTIDKKLTITCWVYGTDTLGTYLCHGSVKANGISPHNPLVYFPDAGGNVVLHAGYNPVQEAGVPSYYWGSEQLHWLDSEPGDWSGQWNHYAFVEDMEADVMSMYCNGIRVAQSSGSLQYGTINPTSMAGNDWFAIGGLYRISYTSGPYKGKIDDFRIYDTALTPGEILYLAQGPGKQVYMPLVAPKDPYEDNRIDFKDYGVLVNDWLTEVLWP